MYRDDENNLLSQYAKRLIKNKAKTIIMAFLKPYIVPIIFFCVIFLLASLLISSVYIQLTGGQTLLSMGRELTAEDKQIKEYTISEVERVNKLDLWYENKRVDEFLDAYGRDQKLALTWGHVYSVAAFNETSNKEDITTEIITKTAEDLHPKFYYISAPKIIEVYDEERERWELYSETTEYLLKRSETIYGNYNYTYVRVRETHDNVRITYYKPDEVKLDGEKYQLLKQYLKDKLKAEDIDMDFQITMVLEAGKGLSEEREQLEWLMTTGQATDSFISVTSTPPDILAVIRPLSEKYNIPVWFLCALIMERSSFDAELVGENGQIGLMQILPEEWETMANKLGYDSKEDIQNPKAQVEVGIKILLECMEEAEIEEINWDTEKLWESQIKPALTIFTKYSGSINTDKVFRYAYDFRISQDQKIWPVPGYTEITSPFEVRIHPITGKVSHHTGIDIAAPHGVPVISVTKGVVVHVGSYGSYGKTVVIRDMVHDYLYGHLSGYNVTVGDKVDIGDTVAFVGSTGLSTGPHLHFGVSIGSFLDAKWINPLDIVKVPK